MELNWTTAVLEIVNFLILVWILKRFLYRPVLRVIEERRAGIEATLAEARERQTRAEDLRARYENRLLEWQQEKQTAREVFQQEMQRSRARALSELDAGLAAEREKSRAVEKRRLREREELQDRKALELGARFATRLVVETAGPDTESRILDLLNAGLEALPEGRRAALRHAVRNTGAVVRVESAHALSAGQRRALERAVHGLLGEGVRSTYHENPDLIAGLRLSVGDWSVGANLRDELQGFVDTAQQPG
ncbi:MAG: F0F1 ATP synthase subunit delta [Pseudomonadota bacterium]|nr:F0F1 ATP synthase subunit delta [Pseudomonadota bacterium]